jgi:hypothetical protein
MLSLKMELIHGYINIQMDGITSHELQVVMLEYGDHVVLHLWMQVKVELYGHHLIRVLHVVLFGHQRYILYNHGGRSTIYSLNLL